MKILNLHGYGALAENTACLALKSCGFTVISPQIDYSAQSPEEILNTLLSLYETEHCEAVTGSSMGGFFSVQIAAIKQCPAVLINPCLTTFLTLPELGMQNKSYILQYTELFSNLAKLDFSKTFAIIGAKDNVIHTHGFLQYLLGESHCILVPDGGHAGSSLPLEELFHTYQSLFFSY